MELVYPWGGSVWFIYLIWTSAACPTSLNFEWKFNDVRHVVLNLDVAFGAHATSLFTL